MAKLAGVRIIGQDRLLGEATLKHIEENIGNDENILFILSGLSQQAIVALEDRIILIKPGFMAGATFGAKVTTFNYKDIISIEINSGLVTGVIEISTASYQATTQKDYWSFSRDRDPFKVSNCLPIAKPLLSEYQPYLKKLNMIISGYKGSPSGSARDSSEIGTQLEKLFKLHECGALTKSEFEIAKKKILSSNDQTTIEKKDNLENEDLLRFS